MFNRSSHARRINVIFYPQVSKQVTVKQPIIGSHAEKAGVSMDKSQRAGGEIQHHKDSETIAGSSSQQSGSMPNTFASAVEAEVPKRATVNKSGSFKDEHKQPGKKDPSTITADKVLTYFNEFFPWCYYQKVFD